MSRHWRNSTVSVDIDIDEIIGDIPTEDLEAELECRADRSKEEMVYETFETKIEAESGCIIQALSNEEICDIVLKAIGRKI